MSVVKTWQGYNGIALYLSDVITKCAASSEQTWEESNTFEISVTSPREEWINDSRKMPATNSRALRNLLRRMGQDGIIMWVINYDWFYWSARFESFSSRNMILMVQHKTGLSQIADTLEIAQPCTKPDILSSSFVSVLLIDDRFPENDTAWSCYNIVHFYENTQLTTHSLPARRGMGISY